MKERRRGIAAAAVAAVAMAGGAQAAPPSGPVAVVQRARLGGYVEETTFLTTGPHAHGVAMTNGYEVYAAGPMKESMETRKIFDTRALGHQVPPKGMAYIESEAAFAFVEGADPTVIFMADRVGRPLPPRTINYLPGPLNFLHNEGLTYLPPSSPVYPDHLLMIANRFPPQPPFIEASIEVIRPDGQVVAQIFPASPLRENYLTGIALKGTDRILVGLNDQLWTIDFMGNIVAGPVTTPAPFVEGIEELPDGRIVVSGASHLYAFDRDLNRLPQLDHDAGIGLGLLLTTGIAWDSDGNQHLVPVNFQDTGDYFQPQVMAALPESLASFHTLHDVNPAARARMTAGLEYLPDEHLVAVLLRRTATQPAEIVLYDRAGQERERIGLGPLGGSPARMTYVPGTRQFALTFAGAARDHKIVLLSRTGALVRELDLQPQGIGRIRALTAFLSAEGAEPRFLVFASPDEDAGRAVEIDFQGQVLSEFNYRQALDVLDVQDAATITSGPNAGAFSVTDALNHEVVTFYYPSGNQLPGVARGRPGAMKALAAATGGGG